MAGKKVAIDLGTANSLVAVQGRGVVVSEPTVVAISLDDKQVLAIGEEAKEMLGKVPGNIVARRPIRQGVIASYKLTEALISNLLNKALGRTRFFKPEVMISVPAGVTSVEERAVIEAAASAGAGKIYLIPEPIAAAIGAKLPISTSAGNMIVNMGGGTSEIAVISMNGIVTFESKRIAGDAVNDAIANHMRRRHNILVGEQMAEKIKIEIGSATLLDTPLEMEVRGRDATSGMPISVVVNSNDIVDSIKVVLNQIVGSIKNVLEKTPPELSSDIIDRGMVLSGGTALIRNIDELFTKATGVPAHVVDNPLHTVVNGVSESLEHLDVIKRSLRGS
ncbi:MAG: rod shape-determining protein [Candidatus Dojkabacteria bacterium]|uniref:Cell shape-determining protein MreB n=1 Tax=Candidatus Dojkabacteria bacterium TaxID=2099670 RepID=A0A952AGD8_9BACT|nr:rod shape-determining protein [Candidatus Dojkabacteria bacterium]WKZ28421.1 MAG: rod shape-determining protein [Candidatus Dojkabacteria bacterium]